MSIYQTAKHEATRGGTEPACQIQKRRDCSYVTTNGITAVMGLAIVHVSYVRLSTGGCGHSWKGLCQGSDRMKQARAEKIMMIQA